jgi:hypothetical protein
MTFSFHNISNTFFIIIPKFIAISWENIAKWTRKQGKVAQPVTILPFIKNVFGSNLGWELNIPTEVFVVFLSPLRQMTG